MANRVVFGRVTISACFVLAAAFCGASLMLTEDYKQTEERHVMPVDDEQLGASFAQTNRMLTRGLAESLPPRERLHSFWGNSLRALITVVLLLCGLAAHLGGTEALGAQLGFVASSVSVVTSAAPRALRTEDHVTRAEETPVSALNLRELKVRQPDATKPTEETSAHGAMDVSADRGRSPSEKVNVVSHKAPEGRSEKKEAQVEAARMQDAVRARLAAAKASSGQWKLEEAEEELREAAARSGVLEAHEKDLLVPESIRASLLKIESLTLLGQFLEANGRPSDALGSLRRAVEASAHLVPSRDSKTQKPHASETVAVVARAEVALARALCAVGGQHGEAFHAAGRYLGLALQSVAHARVGQAAHEFAPLAAEIDTELASCSYLQGNLATAESQAGAAMSIVKDEIPAGPVQGELLRKVARLRGGVKHDEGLFKDALRLYDEYLAASETTEMGTDNNPAPPEVLVERLGVLQDKALAIAQDGHVDEGLRRLDEVERLQHAMNDELLKKSGRHAKKILAKSSKLNGKLWEEMARLCTTRAELLLYRASSMETKLPYKARKSATKGVSMLREGDHKKALGNSLNTLGNVLSAIGRLEEANAAYKESLELLSDVFGSDSPVVASIYDNLGIVAEAAGDPLEALRFFQYALGIQQRTLGISNPDTATSLSLIAANLEKHGNYVHAEVVVAATKALESAVAAYPEGHVSRVEAEERLNSLLKADLTTMIV